jgi:hypothetical protein
VAGGFLYVREYRMQNRVRPAQFLSEEVLVYFRHKDLGAILAEMRTTPLADAVGSINYARLALDIDCSLETVSKIRNLEKIVKSEQAALIFKEFFSKDFTVALLQEHKASDFAEFIHDNLIVIAEPSHNMTLPAMIGSLFRDDKHLTSAQYGKYVIYRIPIDADTSVSLVFVDKLMLATLEERTLRRALDRYDDKLPNLEEDYFFSTLSEKYRKSYLFYFFAVDKLRHQFSGFFKPQSYLQNLLISHLDDWNGFTSGAYAASRDEHFSRDEITLHFNRDINSNAAHFLGIHPEKNREIYHAPKDTLLYYWTNTFDLSMMWKIYIDESGFDAATISEIETGIASLTDISFEEILDLPANNAHLLIGKPSPVDFVPVPNFSFICTLKDSAKTTSALQQFIDKNEIPHQTEFYRAVPLTYWGESRQKGLQPVFSVHEDVLYISSSIRTQKSVIDTIIDGNGIIESESFKIYAKDLLLPNNSTAYIRLSRLLVDLKELVKWSGTLIALQNRKTAYTSKIIIEDLVLPLIDGLKMYSTIATRSYIEDGKIIIESNIVRKPKD